MRGHSGEGGSGAGDAAAGRIGRRRIRTTELTLLFVAGIWSALVLPLGAVLAPIGSYASVDLETGIETRGTTTLIESDGRWVLWYAFAPLAVTLVVTGALWARGLAHGPGVVGWAATGLLSAFTVLSLMTIGVFILPVTLCLIAVCAVRQGKAHVPSV